MMNCNGARSFRILAGESSNYICKVAHEKTKLFRVLSVATIRSESSLFPKIKLGGLVALQ